MKIKTLVFALALLCVLYAACLTQSPSRITQRCPNTFPTQSASVSISAQGTVATIPCPDRDSTFSGIVRTYDPNYISLFPPATNRFSVASSANQAIPIGNNFIGVEFQARPQMVNTSSKIIMGTMNDLYITGNPTGALTIFGARNWVATTAGTPSVVSSAIAVHGNVDIAGTSIGTLTGGSFRAIVGSNQVGTVSLITGGQFFANYGYTALVTDTTAVQANSSATSVTTGTTTNLRLFHAIKGTTNGGATNVCGVCIGNWSGGTGTLTNVDAILIDATVDTGTNRHAIRSLSTSPSLLSGALNFNATYTPSGTTGAQVINRPAFSVNFAAAATSLVVTNSFATVNTRWLCGVQTNDVTMKSVVAESNAGSVEIFANAAATAETEVYCEVRNQ